MFSSDEKGENPESDENYANEGHCWILFDQVGENFGCFWFLCKGEADFVGCTGFECDLLFITEVPFFFEGDYMGSRGDVGLGYRGESFVVVVNKEVGTGRAGGGDECCNSWGWFRRGCYSWYRGFCCGRYGCLGFSGRYGYGLCGCWSYSCGTDCGFLFVRGDDDVAAGTFFCAEEGEFFSNCICGDCSCQCDGYEDFMGVGEDESVYGVVF